MMEVDGSAESAEVVQEALARGDVDAALGWLRLAPREHLSDAPPRSSQVVVTNVSYRDLEELLAERGVEVDHVTLFRWVQRFSPLLIDAAGPCRPAVGDRWFVDETYVEVAGVWRYVYRAVDVDGQILDVFVSHRRDTGAAEWFFGKALRDHGEPLEIVTDKSPVLASVIADLVPGAEHCTDQYANNRIESDHGR